MYEEDQQRVLSMYAELFEDANDEQALLDFLESPTRQAVMLARAYNAKERKLQVHLSSRAEEEYRDDEEAPAFLDALECMREEAEDRGFVHARSGFVPTGSVPKPELFSELSSEPDAVEEEPEAPAPVPETPKDERPEPKTGNGFTFESAPERAAKKEEKPVFVFPPEEPAKDKTERSVSIPLAVLYALFAVPITIVLCVLLLAPAFISLGLCIACGVVGFKVFAAAFGGFYMFSDIMVVLGCGIIIIALGLLFLWIFVWFVGGAIAGLINGTIALGGKWCSKEVPIQ